MNWGVDVKVFDVGEKVVSAHQNCPLTPGEVYEVEEFVDPVEFGNPPIVYLKGYRYGVSTKYLTIAGYKPPEPADEPEEEEPAPALIATKPGDLSGWRVPFLAENDFGTRLHHGLTGLVIVMHRGNHGWKVPDGKQFACLPGQAHAEDLISLVQSGSTVEIVAVDLFNGAWRTLWAKSERAVTYPVVTIGGALTKPRQTSIEPGGPR